MKKITLLIFISFAVLIGCPPPGPDPTQPGGDDKIAVTSIKVTTDMPEMSPDISSKLTVEVQPSNASNKSVVWSSSDETILTVNEDGVVTALDKPGKVTVTATSVSDPSVKGTVSITVLDIREVVYRNGKAYRLASFFDFEKTGLGKEWTPSGSDSSNALKPQENSTGALVVNKLEDQQDTKGISYPLVLKEALYNNAPLPTDKPIAYVEISAQLSTNGVGSGIGVGIGTNGINGENQGRGWGNEFFDDYNGMNTRFNDNFRTAITIKENTYHLFGISFTESKHESFMDGEWVSSATPGGDNFKLAGNFETYYLYFGTESHSNSNNANEAVTVTVDYVAFYYLDETIEIYDPTVLPPPAEGKIPAAMMAEGKKLSLTYYDPFDSMETLKADWDIGNPGIERPEIGNPGFEKPTFVEFSDGLKGYENDRYKQPYWSPRAVDIKDGELLIKVFYDKTIQNKNISTTTDSTTAPEGDNFIPGIGANADRGYGLAGAIHSKRQFPSGLFVTKIKHSWGNRAGKISAHWDAWWAESNNPFSKEYGKKKLFSWDTGDDTRVGKDFVNYNYTDNPYPSALSQYKGINGEQVYEYDMYEWVGGVIDQQSGYDAVTQYQVLHSWPWYGGYPGWDDRMELGVTYGGSQDGNYYVTNDLRKLDARGAGFGKDGNGTTSYNDGGQAKSGDWFYLAMLVTPEKVVMWNFPKDWDWNLNAEAVSRSETGNMNPAFGNSDAPAAYRDADGKSPIQVKYSSELGQWGNQHNLIYEHRDELTPDNPDIMHAEFFAFYAWDTESGTYHKYEEDVDM